MDDALASLTPQQRDTIARAEEQWRDGMLHVRLTRVVRNEHGQVRIAYEDGLLPGEVTSIVFTGGETGYGGALQEAGQFETLYEWPQEVT